MHILQPKHIKLSEKEMQVILNTLNISKPQLPKIFFDDPALPEGCTIGDIIKIERKESKTGEVYFYYRVIV
nr:hypothetical protein [uncultured archaeon]